MISSAQFASSHHSFWSDCFPALENYVRVINAGGYERSFNELSWPIAPLRSALVSEVAFCMRRHPSLTISDAFSEAKIRLANLPGVPVDDQQLSSDEAKAATDLAHRIGIMAQRIAGNNIPLQYDPLFSGCGLLNHSRGDIRTTDVIIEVKSVDRTFRSTDFRQLITYIFQDRSTGSSTIKKLAILNARRGIFFGAQLSDFVSDTSGSNFTDIQNKFFAAVGSGGASR
ncbi:hypothetical protein [Sphingorhabdus lacus]|uniref:Uncharacterized protein n=1 Tax=Sphingorhabdus lacus TaxID=392610 RepID=A0A6I6L546_9SPHN|nr:hypothetical protein [Sphingorhabdus lacus]QGY79187.1 hypothetical protein EUU25_00270 [Sphingorhabdus lacus]